MGRIFSPLNIAAFIFTVIAVWSVSNWNKEKRRTERSQEHEKYVNYLNENADAIMLDVSSKLPMTIEEEKTTFDKISLIGDTLFINCSYSEPRIFYGICDGDVSRALVSRLNQAFSAEFPALVLLRGYNVRVRTRHSGKDFEDFVVSPREYYDAYNHYRENLPLKGYPFARE